MKVEFETKSGNSAEYCFKERTLETNIGGTRRKIHSVWIDFDTAQDSEVFYLVNTEQKRIESFFMVCKSEYDERVFFLVNTPIGWIEIK